MCFGLNRDTAMKSGQIAHLDQDNANASEDNLVFLCLDHHDQYDSKTSQKKGFTADEVKAYRDELSRSLVSSFSQATFFGLVKTPVNDPYAGQYVRTGSENESAEITITPLPMSYEGLPRYFVSGLALWGKNREYGPNLGTLEFETSMETEGQLIYSRSLFKGEISTTVIKFDTPGNLVIRETNVVGQYGMNVFFDGEYSRVDI